MTLQQLLGIELPIIQAPMAGAQGSALAVAVSNAGGLGSLPCAMLDVDAIRKELTAIRAQTTKPFNVNFFCHAQPEVSAEREAAWRAALAPYFAEFGIDASGIPVQAGRQPFGVEAAEVLSEFKPAVISFPIRSAVLLNCSRAFVAAAPGFSRRQQRWTKRVGSRPMGLTQSLRRVSRLADTAVVS